MNMNFDKYEKQFSTLALQNGYSLDNLNKCLEYANPLISKGLPVIYNTSHLASLVGYNKKYLKRAALYTTHFYRSFEISKKNGDKRTLSEPLPSLKEIQTWILNEILYKVKVSKYAKAYVPKRGIKDHVKYHVNEPKVLTLDVKNFFGSIKFELTENMFRELGYSNLISNLLTKICYLSDSLPQGAPTSPCLTNILLIGFDNAISEYCRSTGLKYSRYADDLAFSGEIKKTQLINLVRSELKKIGLRLNGDKTKLMTRNQQQLISGIIVNDKTQVPKSTRNLLRNEFFFIKKFGLSSHLEKTGKQRDYYLKHMLGKLTYLLIFNPKDNEFLEYKALLHEIEKADNML